MSPMKGGYDGVGVRRGTACPRKKPRPAKARKTSGSKAGMGSQSGNRWPQREMIMVRDRRAMSRIWRRWSFSLSRGLARYTRSAPEPVPSRAREMARKEWLAKRTTENTLVKRISRPRVTAETTKRTSRFNFASEIFINTCFKES